MKKATLAILSILFGVMPLHAENWPAWRGAHGTGISTERNLPTEWSATENIRWKLALPEPCNSTPIIWDDHVFLTQGLDGGKRRALIALERRTGQELWKRELKCSVEETSHRQNPPCSSSPVTDGKTVYAHFGSAGVVAYDFQGTQLWHRDLGPMIHKFGNGGSPVIYGDLLIVFHGPGEPTFLAALDRRNGDTVWRSDEVGINHNLFGSWSTPVVVRAGGRDELIMPWPGEQVGSTGWFKAYDPASGKLLWQCDGLGNELYAMPIVGRAGNVVVGVSGHNGPTMAVRTGGAGNVTASNRLWRTDTGNPQRVGSGIIHEDLLYISNATGVVECLVAKTGELIWKKRLSGNLWGSILLADQKLYVSNLEGDTFVLRLGREYEQIAKNSVDEDTYAALAPSNGELFLRTHKHLYCIR